MKIEQIDSLPYRQRLHRPHHHRHRPNRHRPNRLLGLSHGRAEHRRCIQRLPSSAKIPSALNTTGITSIAWPPSEARPSMGAVSAVDIALWDIKGKHF